MFNMAKRLVPQPIKNRIVEFIRRVAIQPGGQFDTKRFRQELDLMNYRIDELSTQIAHLSSQMHGSGGAADAKEPGTTTAQQASADSHAVATSSASAAASSIPNNPIRN